MNHVVRGRLSNATSTRSTEVAMRMMPACNSVTIPGVANVLIVLLDTTNVNSAKTITIGDVEINVELVLFGDVAFPSFS